MNAQDNPASPDYNVGERAELFIKAAEEWASTSIGNDVMFLMGTDFTYSNAQVQYFQTFTKLALL